MKKVVKKSIAKIRARNAAHPAKTRRGERRNTTAVVEVVLRTALDRPVAEKKRIRTWEKGKGMMVRRAAKGSARRKRRTKIMRTSTP